AAKVLVEGASGDRTLARASKEVVVANDTGVDMQPTVRSATGTVVAVQTVPAGVFGHATGLIRGSNGNQQQGVTLVDEGAGQVTVDQQTNLEAGQARELRKKPVDIGASKRTTDVPAATALARLHKDVNTAAGVLNALGKSGEQGIGTTVSQNRTSTTFDALEKPV
ncbi:hypothetical protein A4A49_59704, partial [Nicotiana attenuata]